MRIFAIIILCIVFLALVLMCFSASAQTTTFKVIGQVPYFPRTDTIKCKMLVTMDCGNCLKGAQSMTGYQVVRYNYDPTYTIISEQDAVEISYLSNDKKLLPKWVTVWICKERND